MRRLRIAFLLVFAVAYLSIMTVAFVPLPSVVECDLGPENIAVRSTGATRSSRSSSPKASNPSTCTTARTKASGYSKGS